MKITRRAILVGMVVLDLVTTPVVCAQYTADFQTNVISGVISNWTGNYSVGDPFSKDVLIVQSNGVLTDVTGYLGFLSISSNNSALVTDNGSIWSNLSLYVGYSGFGNSLVISNGGRVLCSWAEVGGGSLSRLSSNSVVLTDTGSVWSNGGDLAVGYPASGSRVAVRNGGLLIDNNGRVGSYASASSNNSVIVSDTGSVWTNTGDLYVGDRGISNSLTVSNGGKVFSGYGYVGYEFDASNNSVLVTGSGSLWTNHNQLSIGYSGARNSLTILNSGVVYSLVGHIGASSMAVSNSVTISGTGAVWNAIGDVFVGENGSNNTLIVSDGGLLDQESYGKLFVGGNVNNNTSASYNRVVVSGGGIIRNSNLFSLQPVYVGYSASGNSLVISNGGQLISGHGFVGALFSSSNNSVLVTGSGSVWSNQADLHVGESKSNTLTVSNGGLVNDFNGYVGYTPSNNTVLVTGTGSVWSNGGALYYNYSRDNSLVISNGGHVINLREASFLHDSVVVTGTGSVWNSGSVTFGGGGSLVISNGGTVMNGDAFAGSGYANSNFTVHVADSAVWQNAALYVGNQGPGNSVTVDGATVSGTNLVIGLDSSTCSNWVQLDSGSLFVTNATHDAVLEVRNGELILNGGILQADVLVMTNACGLFVRNGGTVNIGTLVLDPNLDADGDGLPNGWEQQYGLDPLDSNGANGANGDPDGDGQNNLAEFQAGTDPTNSASAFRILEIAPLDEDMLITWDAAGGKWYIVQTATNLTGSLSNCFYDLNPVIIAPGTNEYPLSVIHLGAATNATARFYRVRLVP